MFSSMAADLSTPPPGAGPVLQTYRRSNRDVALRGALDAGFLAAAKCMFDGTGWMHEPAWWLSLALVGLLAANLEGWAQRLSAGAEWFRRGRKHVRLYELESIKLTGGPGRMVVLRDRQGNRAFVELFVLRANHELYLVVREGIRYSIQQRRAEVNDRARAYFAPDPDPVCSDV
jgi:hypothetical protein